jgi:hypothetical protein
MDSRRGVFKAAQYLDQDLCLVAAALAREAEQLLELIDEQADITVAAQIHMTGQRREGIAAPIQDAANRVDLLDGRTIRVVDAVGEPGKHVS